MFQKFTPKIKILTTLIGQLMAGTSSFTAGHPERYRGFQKDLYQKMFRRIGGGRRGVS